MIDFLDVLSLVKAKIWTRRFMRIHFSIKNIILQEEKWQKKYRFTSSLGFLPIEITFKRFLEEFLARLLISQNLFFFIKVVCMSLKTTGFHMHWCSRIYLLILLL